MPIILGFEGDDVQAKRFAEQLEVIAKNEKDEKYKKVLLDMVKIIRKLVS